MLPYLFSVDFVAISRFNQRAATDITRYPHDHGKKYKCSPVILLPIYYGLSSIWNRLYQPLYGTGLQWNRDNGNANRVVINSQPL